MELIIITVVIFFFILYINIKNCFNPNWEREFENKYNKYKIIEKKFINDDGVFITETYVKVLSYYIFGFIPVYRYVVDAPWCETKHSFYTVSCAKAIMDERYAQYQTKLSIKQQQKENKPTEIVVWQS